MDRTSPALFLPFKGKASILSFTFFFGGEVFLNLITNKSLNLIEKLLLSFTTRISHQITSFCNFRDKCKSIIRR